MIDKGNLHGTERHLYCVGCWCKKSVKNLALLLCCHLSWKWCTLGKRTATATMRKVPVLFAFVLLGVGLFASAEDGLIDIDNLSTTQASVVGEASTSGGSDGDDEDGSSMLSDEGSAASGSGETTTAAGITTPEVTTRGDVEVFAVDVSVVSKSTEKTMVPKSTTKPPSEESTVGPNEGVDVMSSTMPEEKSSEEPTIDPNDGVDAAARTNPEEKALRVLTTEVIAAVIVGAVCAVILIAFLVYRLRKRDEGSYPLTDSSYKDTYKLRGDTGKEAFV